MIRVRKADDHFNSKNEWLDTTHHFSFAEYHDPERQSFGPLRVFNDDTIKPGTGFGFHQHNDMEIVTFVIDGVLEHKDNFGNVGIINPGEVQRMSAGTGVFHSEYNHSDKDPLRLLQMWVFPKHKGLKPSWGQQKFTINDRRDKLLPVISPTNGVNLISIHQDASFYVSNISQDKTVSANLSEGRQAYLYVILGSVIVNNEKLQERDSAEIIDESLISIHAQDESEIILIDLPVNFEKNLEN